MSRKRDLAKAHADAAQAQFGATLGIARKRLAPRALAADGAEALAARAARLAARAKPGARLTRILGTGAALAAIGTAVMLRLAQARRTKAEQAPAPIDDANAPHPERDS